VIKCDSSSNPCFHLKPTAQEFVNIWDPHKNQFTNKNTKQRDNKNSKAQQQHNQYMQHTPQKDDQQRQKHQQKKYPDYY
jgi:hypothetical protein